MKRLFHHVAKGLRFGNFHGRMPMALVKVYLDASGDNRQTVLTAAGFLSSSQKWDRFEREWSEILRGEHVSAMHMTDFVSSGGDFKEWRGQVERRKNFVDKLSDCIRRHTKKGFATTVLISHYNEVDSRMCVRERFGEPYSFCMGACMNAIANWTKSQKKQAEDVLFFVERGDEHQGQMIAAVERNLGAKVVDLPKGEAVPFQAADMVAWKFRNAVHHATFGKVENELDAADVLRSLESVSNLVLWNKGLDEDAIEHISSALGVTNRHAA